MADFSRNVAEEVKCLGLEYPKTIVFCRRYHDCANLYHSLRRDLGMYFTFPPNYPDFHEFRLIEMFTRASTTEMKEKVLHSVCSSEGKVRIVLATTAFGMGIDCCDIRNILHWGPPSTLEQYVQESGRAGRDDQPSTACILYGKPGKYVDEEVKCYALNEDTCRRALLFKNFMFSPDSIETTGATVVIYVYILV